jgi:hypothetical protein
LVDTGILAAEALGEGLVDALAGPDGDAVAAAPSLLPPHAPSTSRAELRPRASTVLGGKLRIG